MKAFSKPEEPHLYALAEDVARKIGAKSELTERFILVALRAAQMFDDRAEEYARRKLPNGEYGALTTLHRDTERVLSSSFGGRAVDTAMALVGIDAFIAILCCWGVWPGAYPAAGHDGVYWPSRKV